RHPVIPAAAVDAVIADNGVRGRIDYGQCVAVLEIDVDLPRHQVVLRDPRLTVEPHHLDDGVARDVDDAFRFGALVGHVHLVEGRRIGDAVGLRFRWKSLDDTSARQINDADLVLTPVRRIDLLAFGDVGDAFDARYVADGLDHRVRL